jgi:hypothetical protein
MDDWEISVAMCARANQPDDPRDQAIARLAAETLKPGAPSAEPCPDAELIAAYADRASLGDHKHAQLEAHFAGCARCQQTLAALGAALEAPIGESVAVVPSPAGAAAAPPAARPAIVQRWLWWLSPAFGAAAAALLWMALRPPAPQPVQTAANFPAEEAPAARSNAPAAPPETPPAASALRDELAVDQTARAQPAESESATATRERTLSQLAEPLGGTLSAATSVQSEVATPAAPQSAVAQAMIAPPAAESAAPAAGPRAMPAPPPSPARNEVIAADSVTSLEARTAAPAAIASQIAPAYRADAQTPQQVRVILYTFSPPTGGATWRLGAGGLIERSTDQGRTWQAQASGVTTDLIAGSASSADVAWVVGRGRVILRTTDGQRWERIPTPADVTGEWAAVAAYDALTATVVADDLRRYSTQDGGQTWTLQQ